MLRKKKRLYFLNLGLSFEYLNEPVQEAACWPGRDCRVLDLIQVSSHHMEDSSWPLLHLVFHFDREKKAPWDTFECDLALYKYKSVD